MKKFLTALIVLIICAGVRVEAAEFTQEQFNKMLSISAQSLNADNKNLSFDAQTFQKNFNDFMTNFIKESNAKDDDAKNMEEIFLIKEPMIVQTDAGNFLARNFLNRIAIVGLVDENGTLRNLIYFTTQTEDKNEAMVSVLVLEAFAKSISPDLSASTIMEDFEKNKNAPIVENGIKFSIATDENINFITAIAE